MRLALMSLFVAALAGPVIAEEPPRADDRAMIFRGSGVSAPVPQPWLPVEGSPEEELLSTGYGSTMGAGRRAVVVHLGFPFLELDYSAGVTDRLDLRAGFRSVYGGMAQIEVGARLLAASAKRASLTLRLGGAHATFSPDEAVMWLTRTRGLALHPGGSISLSLGSAALFLDLGAQLVIDTDPTSPPLGGAGRRLDMLFNVPASLGLEMPLSHALSFVCRAGLILFPGSRDTGEPPAIPVFSAGLSLAH